MSDIVQKLWGFCHTLRHDDIRVRPIPPISSEYLSCYMKSPDYWAAIAHKVTGIGVPNVKRVAAATARADRLAQAVLAKAFRGDRVPTEAELARREGRSFEPAGALLERIGAGREVS